MDSLLSNSQRCSRLADQFVRYGLYTDALKQLDEAINNLKKLKSTVTNMSNSVNVNIQIEQLDRKMRSIVIKEREDLKKKNKIDYLIQNKHLDISSMSVSTQPGVKTTASYAHGAKLSKDDKSVIEELTTTTNEYKKVNRFLIDEIESLKKENSYLKMELSKILSSADSSTNDVESNVNVDECSRNEISSKRGEEDEEEGGESVDLTKYLDADSDDSEDNNAPPLEFTVDS